MRHREKGAQYEGGISIVGASARFCTGSLGNFTFTTENRDSYAPCNVNNVEVMDDDISPRFAVKTVHHSKYHSVGLNSRLAIGVNLTTPVYYDSFDHQIWDEDLGTLKGNYYPSAHFSPSVFDGYDVDSADWNSCMMSLGDQLNGVLRASTGMLANFAQLGQTIRMFTNPFGILNARWKHGVKNTVKNLSKTGSSVWLEKRYGWDNFFRDFEATRNCMKDVDQHIKFLKSSLGVDKTYTAKSTSSDDISPTTPTIGTAEVNVTLENAKITDKRIVRVCFTRPKNFPIYSRAHYASQRLGTNDVCSAMWDLLPFSFVVDWFVDIQKALVATPNMLLNVYGLSKCSMSRKVTFTGDLKIFSTAYPYETGKAKEENVSQTTIFTKYGRIPGLPWDTHIGLLDGLNILHTLDASALILQRLKW